MQKPTGKLVRSTTFHHSATKPTILSDPVIENYGGTINILTPDAASIESISLMRLTTFTHGFNSDLRFI